MFNFCLQCGTKRPTNARFCAECGFAFDDVPKPQNPRTARDVTPSWTALQSSWWISGCFNVESGSGSVSTRYFNVCECHMSPRGTDPCSDCGRSPSTSEEFATGQGDGVYPVFVLEDGTRRVTGAVTFFVPDWALGVENKSESPSRIVEAALPVRVGSIDTPGTLLFNDSYTGFDNSNMSVDVEVPPGRYEVIAWLAEVPILRENDMNPFVRPIAIGVYGADLMSALDAIIKVDRAPDTYEAYRPWNTMMWGVMSHKVPEWGKAARYNYADDTKHGDTERAASWMLQAAVHGDEDAAQAVAQLLHATEPAAVALREKLLTLRGQRRAATKTPMVDPDLVNHAMSSDPRLREDARRKIIDGIDIPAMLACADYAANAGDEADAEFWWLEIATAPPSAGEDAITGGVVGLCNRILIPQGRYEEAALCSRHLLTRSSEESRRQGRSLLDRIDSERRDRGIQRLISSDAWRHVDVTQPGTVSNDQQVHYDRVYAFIVEYAQQGRMDPFKTATQANFLPGVMGWLGGVIRGGRSTALGLQRDTAAKALADWLTSSATPHLARDHAPGTPGLTKLSPGL